MTTPPMAPSRRSRVAPRRRGRAPREPWGWFETVGVAQFLMPAAVYLPFVVGPMRTASRVVGFALTLLALAMVVLSGRQEPGRPFPARPWMTVAAVWVLLSVLHPTGNSLVSAVAQAGLILAVVSPVFWVGAAGVTPRRLRRMLTLLFVLVAASTLLGLAQFYFPGRFDPPNFKLKELNADVFESLFYTTPDGRRVLRPPGLTDTPGAAATAGAVAFLLGLGLSMRDGLRIWMRVVFLGAATAGMAMMYFGQVRSSLLASLLGAAVLVVLMILRGESRRATVLLALGGALFALALAWAARSGGDAVLERFRSLVQDESLVETYYKNRGHFVQVAFFHYLPSYPLGAGLGRWGMTYEYFGVHRPYGAPAGPLWCEDQFSGWIVDGGAVLLVAYLGGLAVAMLRMVQIVRTTPDRDLALDGAVVTALCLYVGTIILGAPIFLSAFGLTFWLLAAGLHAADHRARLDLRRARQEALASRWPPPGSMPAPGSPPPPSAPGPPTRPTPLGPVTPARPAPPALPPIPPIRVPGR